MKNSRARLTLSARLGASIASLRAATVSSLMMSSVLRSASNISRSMLLGAKYNFRPVSRMATCPGGGLPSLVLGRYEKDSEDSEDSADSADSIYPGEPGESLSWPASPDALALSFRCNMAASRNSRRRLLWATKTCLKNSLYDRSPVTSLCGQEPGSRSSYSLSCSRRSTNCLASRALNPASDERTNAE